MSNFYPVRRIFEDCHQIATRLPGGGAFGLPLVLYTYTLSVCHPYCSCKRRKTNTVQPAASPKRMPILATFHANIWRLLSFNANILRSFQTLPLKLSEKLHFSENAKIFTEGSTTRVLLCTRLDVLRMNSECTPRTPGELRVLRLYSERSPSVLRVKFGCTPAVLRLFTYVLRCTPRYSDCTLRTLAVLRVLRPTPTVLLCTLKSRLVDPSAPRLCLIL